MIFRLNLIVGALPNTLLNGTTADATQVMADLNFIVNQVNANAAPLATTALTNANNNFTTVQSGQAATQPANFPTALQIQNNALQTLSSVLGTNTITARISAVPLGAYVSGQVFTFIPSNPNTAGVTLNVDGVGARSILTMGSALSGAELQNYAPAIVGFNANVNAFDLLNGTPYVQGPNIVSAATLNLDGTTGDYNQVDGTANITALTLSRGRQKMLEFNSSPLLTNSSSLVMGSNVIPTPGDVFLFRGEASGVVRLVNTFRQGVAGKKMTRTVVTASGAGFYIPPIGCTYLDVELVGAGGGGGAAATNGGVAGGNTTFGPLTGNGGAQGVQGDGAATGGAGGTASGGDVNIAGAAGRNGSSSVMLTAGDGGSSYFGGSGAGGTNAAGGNASANSGSGGGGGSRATPTNGGGGGAGGYCRGRLPAVSFPLSVGAKGTGGAAGVNAGGNGGDGIIIVTEFYT